MEVSKKDGCKRCGNRDSDKLAWGGDKYYTLTCCYVCGEQRMTRKPKAQIEREGRRN